MSAITQTSFSYGFDLACEGDSLVYVASIDSASDAFSKGLRIGNEVIAWNQLPVLQARDQVDLGGYRKIASDPFRHLIQLYQLSRSDAQGTVQIYYTNDSGNHRGIAIRNLEYEGTMSPYPLPVTGESTFFWKEIKDEYDQSIGILIDLRKSGESIEILKDLIINRYRNLPIMIIQGPLTMAKDLDSLSVWTQEDQIKTIGHWPADGYDQSIGPLPDILIPTSKAVMMDYYLGWDPLVEEGRIHLLRMLGDQSVKR